MTLRRHQDKEMIVARREHQQTQPREIRVTFEPSRLSHSSVAQAYEQVVPIPRSHDLEAIEQRPSCAAGSPRGLVPWGPLRAG
jgi:hypothetical protein